MAGCLSWPTPIGAMQERAVEMMTRTKNPQVFDNLSTSVIFSESELRTIENGLRSARERFKEFAKLSRDMGDARLAEQFERQADESLVIANGIIEEIG